MKEKVFVKDIIVIADGVYEIGISEPMPSCGIKIADDQPRGWSDYDSGPAIIRKSNEELFNEWFKNHLGELVVSDRIGIAMREAFLAACEIKDKQ